MPSTGPAGSRIHDRTMTEPVFCSGLADIAARYAGFIVDQWGVVHDGAAPYPDALDCLAALRAAGKRVVLLSNSGKRTAINRRHLEALGIGDDLFDAVVTSGEATWRALADRTDPRFAALGRRCVFWTRDGDRSLLDGLDLEPVAGVDDADFLLLAGTDDDARLEDFVEALGAAAARGLPLVCANPDVTVVRPGGGLGMAPGAVAGHYQTLGGEVLYVGKPHRPVYELCLATLGLPPAGVLAIGDSVAHDIAGGARMGVATALVMAGIHAALFDPERGPSANRAALARLEADYGATPDWVLPRLCWRGL